MALPQNLWVVRRFMREKGLAGRPISPREGADDFGAHFRHARERGHPDRPVGGKALRRTGFPLSETVDFLRVGVAAALVAAVRDDSEQGQAPRLQRRCDGTRLALVRSSCRHRLSTLSFAGMTTWARRWRVYPRILL